MAEIKGKYAIVTGGRRGIGREIATALAREGVDLLLVSRTGEALISLCDELKEYSRVSYFVADLSDSGQMKKLFTHARKNEIKPDILIHSAGQVITGI
jgi:short-subunit dehydrogenase